MVFRVFLEGVEEEYSLSSRWQERRLQVECAAQTDEEEQNLGVPLLSAALHDVSIVFSTSFISIINMNSHAIKMFECRTKMCFYQ